MSVTNLLSLFKRLTNNPIQTSVTNAATRKINVYRITTITIKSNIEELLSKSIHTGDESKDKYVLNYLENIVIHNDIKYHDSKVRLNSATAKSKVDVLNCKLSQLEDDMNISFCIE